jgi:cystathionine beta-lyase/cystathionine gamma-synthase
MSNLIIDPMTKIYMRYTNDQNELLKNKLSNMYNQSNVIIANSGLHANFLAIESILKSNNIQKIIYPIQLYYETISLINSFNINKYSFDINDDQNLINQFNDQPTILFIESCSNPNGYIFYFDMIPKLRSLCTNLYIICDNSWLSNYIFNPFDHLIDIVTTSLTKYYSGGNCICGACIVLNENKDLYINLDIYIRLTGIHISPLQIKIVNKYIDNTETRINVCSNLTKQTINYLQQQPNIIINHPNVNPLTINLARRYFKNSLYTSTFTFGIKINNHQLQQNISKLTILHIETSFGTRLTIIDNHINMINDYSFIRISIGYEDTIDRIIKGLNELFDNI